MSSFKWDDLNFRFLIGISLSIASSLLSTLSLALQRLSHKRNAALPEDERVSAGRQRLNIIGVTLLFLGSLSDFAALGFAPATLISCMGSLTLVLNMVLAPLMLQEHVLPRDLFVNLIVIVGTLISVWFGPHETPDYDLDYLLQLLNEPAVIIYQSIFTVWIVILLIIWTEFEKDDAKSPVCLTRMKMKTRKKLLRFTYPAIAGSVGGMTQAYAKSSIELLKTSILHENQFSKNGTYFVVSMMIICVLVQIKFLNAGLKRYSAVYIVPTYQALWIIFGIIAGMVYFKEIDSLPTRNIILFMVGAVISVVGIVLHSDRAHHHDHGGDPDELDLSDEEEEEEQEALRAEEGDESRPKVNRKAKVFALAMIAICKFIGLASFFLIAGILVSNEELLVDPTPAPAPTQPLPPEQSVIIKFDTDPPTQENCRKIAKGESLDGQYRNRIARKFEIEFDVIFDASGTEFIPYHGQLLKEALQRDVGTVIAGCNDAVESRRLLKDEKSRQLLSKYVIANAMFEVGPADVGKCEAEEKENNCHKRVVDLGLYLKADEDSLDLVHVILNALDTDSLVSDLHLKSPFLQIYTRRVSVTDAQESIRTKASKAPDYGPESPEVPIPFILLKIYEQVAAG